MHCLLSDPCFRITETKDEWRGVVAQSFCGRPVPVRYNWATIPSCAFPSSHHLVQKQDSSSVPSSRSSHSPGMQMQMQMQMTGCHQQRSGLKQASSVITFTLLQHSTCPLQTVLHFRRQTDKQRLRHGLSKTFHPAWSLFYEFPVFLWYLPPVSISDYVLLLRFLNSTSRPLDLSLPRLLNCKSFALCFLDRARRRPPCTIPLPD